MPNAAAPDDQAHGPDPAPAGDAARKALQALLGVPLCRPAAASPRPLPTRVEGWPVLAMVRSGELPIDAILAALELSGLHGMGGAGAPVTRRWQAVRAQPRPRQLVVNAWEGDPGSGKDRWILEHNPPQRFLEGMLIAAEAIGAEAIWIVLRDEYAHLHAVLRTRLSEMMASGVATVPVHLHRGAGHYAGGEETALLETLEGRPARPRPTPPFPVEHGLFGAPTLVQNVETLWWLPELLSDPDRFAAAGRRGAKGWRLFSVSGRVALPGVHRAPNGSTARELIEAYAGGIADGHRFAAFLPGGALGGILPAGMADLPLTDEALAPHGCAAGTGAVTVLSDRDNLAAVATALLRFLRDENCGQCAPCRDGTAQAAALLDAPRRDHAALAALARPMADGSICGLGQRAMTPVLSLLRHFPAGTLP